MVESDLDSATQNNGATCPTPLPVPSMCGGRRQDEYDSGINDAPICDTVGEVVDGSTYGIVRILQTQIRVER